MTRMEKQPSREIALACRTRKRKIPRPSWVKVAAGLVLLAASVMALGVGISRALAHSAATSTVRPSSTSDNGTTNSAIVGPEGRTGVNAPSGANGQRAPQKDAPLAVTAGGASAGQGGYSAVFCSSTSSCIAVGADGSGDAIAATSDDGSTWQQSSIPAGVGELDAVTCLSTTSCVAGGRGSLLSSSDGGQTWTQENLPVANTTLLGMTCTGGSTCVAAGISPQEAEPYAGTVVVSTDGGQTWQSASMPAGTLGLGSVACPTATRCIAIGATVMVSNNAGQTWSQVGVNGGVVNLRSLACSSATTCVAIGPSVEVNMDPTAEAEAIVSNDAGATWNPEALPSGEGLLSQITCTGTADCLAAGAALPGTSVPTFASSSDGGLSWNPATPPSGVTAVAGISCPSPTMCVAVGSGSSTPVTAVTTNASQWSTSKITASRKARA